MKTRPISWVLARRAWVGGDFRYHYLLEAPAEGRTLRTAHRDTDAHHFRSSRDAMDAAESHPATRQSLYWWVVPVFESSQARLNVRRLA